MTPFETKLVPEGDRLTVFMSGAIDEDAEFPSPSQLAEFKSITLDLEGVNSIDSIGIRQWLSFIEPLSRQEGSLVLRRVPAEIVFQFNMIKGFLPTKAMVESVHLPLYCDKCDKEASALVELFASSAHGGATLKPDMNKIRLQICKEEGCSLKAEYSESKYFGFVKYR